jgi:hypothetical protein
MTKPFVQLRDAAAPIIEKLKKPTVSRASVHLLFIEFDDALVALERFGSVIEKPVGSLRAVRNCFAELLEHD